MHKVIELTDSNIEKLKSTPIAIIDFWAEWCQPCVSFMPTFEEVSKEFKSVSFFKFDVDSNQNFAQSYSVRSVPTIILLKNGEEEDRKIGPMDSQSFKNWIESNI